MDEETLVSSHFQAGTGSQQRTNPTLNTQQMSPNKPQQFQPQAQQYLGGSPQTHPQIHQQYSPQEADDNTESEYATQYSNGYEVKNSPTHENQPQKPAQDDPTESVIDYYETEGSQVQSNFNAPRSNIGGQALNPTPINQPISHQNSYQSAASGGEETASNYLQQQPGDPGTRLPLMSQNQVPYNSNATSGVTNPISANQPISHQSSYRSAASSGQQQSADPDARVPFLSQNLAPYSSKNDSNYQTSQPTGKDSYLSQPSYHEGRPKVVVSDPNASEALSLYTPSGFTKQNSQSRPSREEGSLPVHQNNLVSSIPLDSSNPSSTNYPQPGLQPNFGASQSQYEQSQPQDEAESRPASNEIKLNLKRDISVRPDFFPNPENVEVANHTAFHQLRKQNRDKARLVRKLLSLTLIDIRALKNRLSVSTLFDYVDTYRRYAAEEREEEFRKVARESLTSAIRGDRFVEALKYIVDVEVTAYRHQLDAYTSY